MGTIICPQKELAVLMNSAYIYIPYISRIHKKDKDNLVQVKLDGGISFWQILIDENNKAEVKQVYKAKTKGRSFV